VFRYDAASIALRDPERQLRIPLASAGDAAALHAYWSSEGADAELARLGLNRPGPPLLSTELSLPVAETVYWRRYLAPAGFRGGIDAALFTADGGHVGHLTVLTEADARPTLADRDMTGVLAPLIARAVDRLPAIAMLAGIVPDVFAGAVLTAAGNTLPLPGLPIDPVLAVGSPVVAEVVERLADGDLYASFLHPAPDGGAGTLLRVTALDCSKEAADHLRAAVLLPGAGSVRAVPPRPAGPRPDRGGLGGRRAHRCRTEHHHRGRRRNRPAGHAAAGRLFADRARRPRAARGAVPPATRVRRGRVNRPTRTGAPSSPSGASR
jgi:hypothetical protein